MRVSDDKQARCLSDHEVQARRISTHLGEETRQIGSEYGVRRVNAEEKARFKRLELAEMRERVKVEVMWWWDGDDQRHKLDLCDVLIGHPNAKRALTQLYVQTSSRSFLVLAHRTSKQQPLQHNHAPSQITPLPSHSPQQHHAPSIHCTLHTPRGCVRAPLLRLREDHG